MMITRLYHIFVVMAIQAQQGWYTKRTYITILHPNKTILIKFYMFTDVPRDTVLNAIGPRSQMLIGKLLQVFNVRLQIVSFGWFITYCSLQSRMMKNLIPDCSWRLIKLNRADYFLVFSTNFFTRKEINFCLFASFVGDRLWQKRCLKSASG